MTERLESAAGLSRWLHRLAVYQYLAPLVADRDVIELDCGSGVGARFLASLGARRVVGVDANEGVVDRARLAHALTNLEFRPGVPSAVEVEESSFDVAFVPDGARVLRRAGALDELRRLLRPNGALVLAVASADRPAARAGASYFDVRERLEPRFGPVRMFAGSPFVGMSLVGYDEHEPDVELDTSLLELHGDDDVTHYVAVCGGLPVSRGFSVVQLPARSGAHLLSLELGVGLGILRGTDEAEAATELAERTLARLREFEESLARTAAPAPRSSTDDTMVRLDRALADERAARRRIAELERSLEEAHLEVGRVAADSETELATKRKDLEGMRKRLRELEDRSGRPRSERPVSELVAEAMTSHAEAMREAQLQLDERVALADELRGERDAARAEARLAREQLAALGERLASVEQQLADRRHAAAVAEGEVLRERAGRERAEQLATAAIAADVRDTAGELDRVRTRLSDTEARLADARKELAMAHTELSLLKGDAAYDDVSELRTALEAARRELADSRRQTAEARDAASPASFASPASVDELAGVVDRLEDLERTLQAERDVARELDRALRAVHEQVQAGPSAGSADSDVRARLESVLEDLASKEADIMILNVGVEALRARLREVVESVDSARSDMSGRAAADMAAVMERLTASLDRFRDS